MTSSGPHQQFSADRPVRRRRRPAVVCTECRRRKIACDRKLPCGQCTLHGADCVYGPTANGNVPRATAAGGPRKVSAATSPAGTSTRSANGASAEDSRTTRSFAKNGSALQPRPSPQEYEGDEYEDVDDEAASAHEIERMQGLMGTYYPRLSGRVCKTRLFGQSHWANNLVDQFRKVHHVNYQIFFLSDSSLHKQLRQCKILSKALKARHLESVNPASSSELPDFTAAIPPRDVADRLVQTYLRTFEAVFRILHIPTFLDECERYWEDPNQATEVFMTKFLIVLAIGSCTYDNEPGGLKETLRIAACRAIVKAHAWQGAAISKHALTLDMIQVYCLVLLSRQTSAVEYGDDIVWISAGSLMHTAFTMGLHRDPGLFAGLTQYEIEMRRRLWATILEFVVQASLDSGMPPLISPDDFDCGPPSNINDEQMSPDGGKSMLEPPLPDTVLTQTSCQRLLLRSLPLRLRIAKFLNGLVVDQSYNEALRLSRELSSCCRTASALLESMGRNVGLGGPDHRKPSAFQVQLIDILTRRFFHSLHAPWARKSLVHVQYYYSRRMHLDSALQIVAILTGDANLLGRIGQQGDEMAAVASPGPAQDDLDLMRIHGRGLFKCVLLDTCTTVTFEAIQQLQEDPSLLGFDGSMTLSQKDLYKAVTSIVALSHKRIVEGETNFKAYCFYSCCLGQVNGMLAGLPVQEAILAAARKALDASLEMLKDRIVKSGVPFPPTDFEESAQESAKAQAQQPQDTETEDIDPEIDGPSMMGDTAAYIMSGPSASGQHDLLTMPGITVDFRGNGQDDDQWMDFGLGPIDFDSTSESWILSGVGSEAPPSAGL